LTECEFTDNKSSGHGATMNIDLLSTSQVKIFNTIFDNNIAGYSITYFFIIPDPDLQLNNSLFTNNNGSSIYLSSSKLYLIDNVVFENNTADYGAAVYLDQGAVVEFDNNATVMFINNFVSHNRGAIYIDMIFPCNDAFVYSLFDNFSGSVVFVNNSAGLVGNSLYFDIPKFCQIEKNIYDKGFILFDSMPVQILSIS